MQSYDSYVIPFENVVTFFKSNQLTIFKTEDEKEHPLYYAFFYICQFIERLWDIEMPLNCKYTKSQWQETLKLKVRLGLVKETTDCGTSSVSMGAAVEWFAKNPKHKTILILNCGSGGIKFQIFAIEDDVVKVMDELKGLTALPSPNAVQIGNYIPENVRDWVTEQQTLIQVYWEFTQTIYAGIIDAEFAFVTGKVRESYEKSDMQEQKVKNNNITQYFQKNLGIAPFQKSYFLSQAEEARLEALATKTLYENLFQKNYLTQKVTVDQTWGIGQGSSQIGDFILYQSGMNDLQALSYLPKNTLIDCQLIEMLMDRWNQRPELSLIALKSGCALLPDKYPALREMLFDILQFKSKRLLDYKTECEGLVAKKEALKKRMLEDKFELPKNELHKCLLMLTQ